MRCRRYERSRHRGLQRFCLATFLPAAFLLAAFLLAAFLLAAFLPTVEQDGGADS